MLPLAPLPHSERDSDHGSTSTLVVPGEVVDGLDGWRLGSSLQLACSARAQFPDKRCHARKTAHLVKVADRTKWESGN